MNFSKGDMFIGMSMSVAVIFMSFTFPALGMTGDSVNESEIPEFNASKGTYQFATERPKYPDRPSKGTLRYVNGSETWEDNRQTYLQRGGTEYLISFYDSTKQQPNATYQINLIKFNSSGSWSTSKTIAENESKTLTAIDEAYKVGFNNLNIEQGDPDNIGTVDWNVITQPSDTSWVGRLPVVGSIISGADQLAAIVGWIGSVLWHFVYQFIVLSTNVFTVFFNIISYVINFMVWLLSTYGNIVTGAPTAWASVIVAIPGILLSFEFMKLIALGISLLPFT